jgi:hypothetical protein
MTRTHLILAAIALAGLIASGSALATGQAPAAPASGDAAPAPSASDEVQRIEEESRKAGRVPLSESDC